MKQNSTQTNCLSGKWTITALLSVIFLMITMAIQAQAVREYTSAEANVLQTDLAAGTYDIYELATEGGNYVFTGTTSTTIALNKNITIRAKSGLAVKPIISLSTTSTGATLALFVPNIPDMIFRLEGIEFNGLNLASSGQPILIKSVTTATNCQIIVRNCYFHHFLNAGGNGTIRLDASGGSSMDIQGSVFDNCGGRILYFGSSDYNSTTFVSTSSNGDCILKDNTFSNITGAFTNPNAVVHYKSTSGVWAKGVNFIVDHCTFYNAALTTDPILKLRIISGAVIIRNCIFDLIPGTFSFTNPDTNAPAQVIDYNYLAGFTTPPTGTNTISTVPAYINTTTLNFGLTDRIPFAGSDSYTIGNTMYYGVPTDIKSTFAVKGRDGGSFRAYPNPVSGNVTFDYALVRNANVRIDVYNLNNQMVKSFVNNEPHAAGSYSKSFDVSGLKPGIYFARFTMGTTSKAVKLIVKR